MCFVEKNRGDRLDPIHAFLAHPRPLRRQLFNPMNLYEELHAGVLEVWTVEPSGRVMVGFRPFLSCR